MFNSYKILSEVNGKLTRCVIMQMDSQKVTINTLDQLLEYKRFEGIATEANVNEDFLELTFEYLLDMIEENKNWSTKYDELSEKYEELLEKHKKDIADSAKYFVIGARNEGKSYREVAELNKDLNKKISALQWARDNAETRLAKYKDVMRTFLKIHPEYEEEILELRKFLN